MEESADGYDAQKAFNQRRQIYLAVQEIQRLEHEVFKRISDSTTKRKRELLEILSAWLLDQKSESPNHRQVEMLSGCPMRTWLDLQRASVPLQDEVNRCTAEARVAENEYNTAAPLRIVSEWTADGERKTHLQQLAATKNLKIANRDMATRRMDENIEARQVFAKQFLRGCLSELGQLSTTNVFGERARRVVGELATAVADEWRNHVQANSAAVASIENNIQQLRQIYRMNGR